MRKWRFASLLAFLSALVYIPNYYVIAQPSSEKLVQIIGYLQSAEVSICLEVCVTPQSSSGADARF